VIKDFSVELSTHELLLVLDTLGPCLVMGVEDPYLGMMAEEVAVSQRSALDSLLRRDLIHHVSEDKTDLHDQIFTIASVIHHPNHSLIIHSKEISNGEFHCYIHFRNERIVRHIPSQSQHQLILGQNIVRLSNDLNSAFRSGSKAESRGPSFTIGEEALFEIRRLCAEGELNEAKDWLDAEGVPSEVISMLIKTLSEPVATSSFVLVVNRNNIESQYVRGFSVIEGVDEMWIMEPYEENGKSMVIFQSASAFIVRERFFELIPWRKDG
jgi:hypothetical protein